MKKCEFYKTEKRLTKSNESGQGRFQNYDETHIKSCEHPESTLTYKHVTTRLCGGLVICGGDLAKCNLEEHP